MKLKLVRTPINSFVLWSCFPFLKVGRVYDVNPEDVDLYESLCSDVKIKFGEHDDDVCTLDLSCFEPADDEAKEVFSHPKYKPGYLEV